MPIEHRITYARVVGLSFATALILVPLGYLADRLDVAPGVVPILDPPGRLFWLLGLVLAVGVGVLAQLLDRDQRYSAATARARDVRFESASDLATAWIFPLLTAASAVLLLSVYHSPTGIAAIAFVAFAMLLAGGIAHHHLFDEYPAARVRARGVYTVVIHILAFGGLSMVYINKVRSLFSATGVLIFTILLLIQLTDGEDALFVRRLVYALAGGVLLGQVTWVLNYWEATGWTGGAALLVFFYLSAGLIQSQLRGGTTVHDVAEYGVVASIAYAIVIYSLFV